jgi:hypothetical protein
MNAIQQEASAIDNLFARGKLIIRLYKNYLFHIEPT